ncbi:hypothetical protein ACTR8H_000808 [Escherichia coli]
MSTIIKEFTKEQLQQIIETDHVQCGEASALARIALASLEAEPAIHRWRRVTFEPYGPYPWHYGNFIGFSKPVDGIEDEYYYAAPPAPVSVPAAMEMDDDFDSAFEHGKAVGWNAYRAAMLQAEPVSNSDELPLDYLQGHKDGLEWAAQLAEANHPQTGDWLYDDQIELARAIRKGPDMPTVQGGNSPVIPDGWVMVPVELTPDMRAAWDSAPYTDDDDNDMQAAYRAMIAAAPQWKVK